ncbi:phosphoheptose isomerase [Saccharomonospora azurea SZMC 14600]|uniref:D-sedoheptulose-7-phosphate isomerase n=1 Tax=Saccharomonospora azurea TaxID=40988 RepID=UPI00024007DD|nr:SIS domain-containing protein [Saccharomonospora azurea]EHK88032.1 phosphoheptose isomerase [Saccharomonospora azurea SZMC 14600]
MTDRHPLAVRVDEALERRRDPLDTLSTEAEPVARACHAMAARFHRGGTLVVFGNGGGSTDAQHISVEFVHPVIVGKRALPALSLTADIATMTGIAARVGFDEVFAHQLRHLAGADDIALGLSVDGDCANVVRGFEQARELGMLTVALVGGDGGAVAGSEAVDHVLRADSHDPRVIKEVHVTMYHVLWELVHVFLEHPGVLTRKAAS